MFLARIVADGNSASRQYVHGIRGTEFQLVDSDNGESLQECARRRRAWQFAYGVAAIWDTADGAVGAAKAFLERLR